MEGGFRESESAKCRLLSSRFFIAALLLLLVTTAAAHSPPLFLVDPSNCAERGKIHLDLVRSVPSNLSAPPVSLAVLSDSAFLALRPDGSLGWIGAPEYGRAHGADQIYAGVVRIGKGVLAFTDHTLFMLDSDNKQWRKLDLHPEVTHIRSVALGPAPDILWIVAGPHDGASVHRFRRAISGLYEMVDSWELSGNRRLIPLDGQHALAISTRLPFDALRLEKYGALRSLGSLHHKDLTSSWPDSAAPYLAAVALLDCGALLTIADARSRARTLLFVDAQTGRVIRASSLDATMGFFDSRPEQRRLYAYRATEDGGEMLVYEWKWIVADSVDHNVDKTRGERK